MHFSTATIILAALATASLISANFDIYAASDNMAGSGNTFGGWTIHPTPPDCNRVVNHAEMWFDQDDVSGDKLGVRCEGKGCFGGDPKDVNILEMHFTNKPLFHWTIYKDRGHPYKMYGRNGKTYGECIMYPGDSYDCTVFDLSSRSGVRMFRCLTQWTVGDIERGSW